MSEHYVQSVDVELRKGARTDQILGVILQLVGLGMIFVAVFWSYYAFIAVGVFVAVGIWLTQRFYSSPREFEYAYSRQGLVVSRRNIVGKSRRILEIAFKDVKAFTKFYDIASENDFVATANHASEDVKVIVFSVDGTERRLLFSPDEYLAMLIGDTLRKGKKSAEKSTDK